MSNEAPDSSETKKQFNSVSDAPASQKRVPELTMQAHVDVHPGAIA